MICKYCRKLTALKVLKFNVLLLCVCQHKIHNKYVLRNFFVNLSSICIIMNYRFLYSMQRSTVWLNKINMREFLVRPK